MQRGKFGFVMSLFVIVLLMTSCECWWFAFIYNNSTIDVYCVARNYADTTLSKEDAFLIEAGKSSGVMYGATIFEPSYEKKRCYLYTFVSADSVAKKGWEKVSEEQDFICRYEVYGRVFDKLGNTDLSYPPTQKMLDAGVRVLYPEDYGRHR